ncbi:MAG: SIMPL domain-containing protein [Candidatus Brockarchaeota archaeon]|nr:SIMPL domain-containing protein [Candidatus Brockarchaeota archaeon]
MEEMLSRKWLLVLSAVFVATIGVNLALLVGIYPALISQQAGSENRFNTVEKGFAKTLGTLSLLDTGQAEQQAKTISVTGTGVVKAKPDRAVLSLSVVTQAESAGGAISENADKMDSVIKAVRSMGILENQTETSAYSLTPIWEYPKEGGSPRIVGYTCSNTIRVTVKNLNKVGEVIDAAVKAGANQVSSLQFTISDEAMRQLGLNALILAVKDASSKASTIAAAAGLTLVGPVSISLSGYSPYVRSYAFETVIGSVATPIISPEEVSVTVSVTAIYEFN